MQVMATALAGLQAAEARMEKTARTLARGVIPADAATDKVDLSAEMVALMEARNDAAVSVKVMHTAEEMERLTIDSLCAT